MNKKFKLKKSVKSRTESVRGEFGVSGRGQEVRAGRVFKKATRAYHLPCFPNRDKLETAKYLINRFNLYVEYCVGREFFNTPIKSTKGCGQLFNMALHKARDIIKKQRKSKKETGNKINVPNIKKERPLVKFEKSNSSNFDYFAKVSNQFKKSKTVKIPVKSTKVLNKALKNGWGFTNFGEIFFRNNKMFLTVFVQKEVEVPSPKKECLGVDVGIKKSVTTSIGYKGGNLSLVISKFKKSQSERYRQRTRFNQKQILRKTSKTYLKQILDREAKKVVARCKDFGISLSVESRKSLQNLKTGKLSLWARNYFANRCEILCKEMGVFFVEVWPSGTSITCSKCGHKDRDSRQKELFECTSCGFEMDADYNAAINISHRGRQVIEEKIIPKLAVRLPLGSES